METEFLHERVSIIASKFANKTAIEHGDRSICYSELEERANQIANTLNIKIGNKRNIAVMLENGIEIIETMMGIFKCGAVFAPLDPLFPESRIKLMINSIDADWVVTQSAWLNKLNSIMENENKKINVLVLDSIKDEIENYKNLNILEFDINMEKNYCKSLSNNKHCYIYFTSGSTGTPKAILGRHRSLKHFIDWEIREFGINEDFKISQLTSITFDPFLRDVFVALCTGATLYIPKDKESIITPNRLIQWIDEKEITLVHMVPTIFKAIMHEIEESNHFEKLRYVLLAGELLRGNDIRKFIELFDTRIQLVNLYGPTETTLVKLFHRVDKSDVDRISVPVGKPMNGTQVMILNDEMQICDTGSIGEIYIRTPYITSGYYNNVELSRKVFLQNPFSDNPNDIIYKTGDLGRMLPSGNVEICGRIDHQVKLRGVRIELGEIESHILGFKGVKEVVVVARDDSDGNKYLCAYIISSNQLIVSELKKYLYSRLPDSMIPTGFVQLSKMPLTSSGKIDRNALPEPQFECETEYEAPENETQEKVLHIWSDILKRNDIGINHNFFDVGGHSLRAAEAVSRIHKELNFELSLRDIFENPTIKLLDNYMKQTKCNVFTSIKKVEEKEYYPVSAAQRRIYMLNQLEGVGTTYNISKVIILEGILCKEKLEQAFKELVRRHESLRTSFEMLNGEIVQKIHKESCIEVIYEEAEENQILELKNKFIQPFDLSKAPLIRVKFVKIRNDKHILFVDMHHIVSDGVSTFIMIREFADLYNEKKLPELSVQYKDFTAWQNKLFESEAIKKQEEYWVNTFEGDIPVLNIPTDYSRPAVKSFDGNEIYFEIDNNLSEKLKLLAKNMKSSLYVVLLSAYYTLLSKYTGQEDIVVGSPIAGRNHADTQNMIGMFVNTLALRNYPKGEKTFEGFLKEVRDNFMAAYENQSYQFEELVTKLELERHLDRNPLFDTMFVLHNKQSDEISINDLIIKPYNNTKTVSKFDLTFNAVESEDNINVSVEYCTKLFNEDTIKRLISHFKRILEEITDNPKEKIKDIDMVSEEEKKQILFDFNETKAVFPDDKTIHQIFQEQVNRTPDNTAIIFDDKSLTYSELNSKANQLARELLENGVKPNEVIGLVVERSMEMIIGMIAILKSGGAYLPIDPAYPKDRIIYTLEDSKAQILLTKSNLLSDLKYDGKIINMDKDSIYLREDSNLRVDNTPNDLAYVIYTSGTTGKPKGVMIQHKNVVRLLFNDKFQFDFSESDVWTMFHSFCFDFSVWEMYGALLYGGKLVVVPKSEALDTTEFLKLLKRNKVTVLNQTPTAFNNLIKADNGNDDGGLVLRYVIFGGEALKPAMLKSWKVKYPNTKLINMYGITETTVHVTYKEITEHEINLNISNIGKPIPTLNVYIMDKYMNVQPIGIPGELCVGGIGVGKGYLNKPELTSTKFIVNPYNEKDIIYRSGDLARLLPGGDIEYMGRIDHQVKIRGFRIELGEIENQILKHEAVNEAVVITREDDKRGKYLCAYIVIKREVTVDEIREHLGKTLPDYMIPSYFKHIDKIPLTSNGKVNKKALPEPDGNIITGVEYVAPRNEIETKLKTIWEEVLGVEVVGINDNFFSLGGDSIKAIQVASRLNKYGLKMDIKDLFKYHSIGQLSRFIKTSSAISNQSYVEGEVSLTPIQVQFFQEKNIERHHFNHSIMIFRESGFDEVHIRKVFTKIVEHHDALRMVFKTQEKIIKEYNRDLDGEYFELTVVDLRGEGDCVNSIEEEANKVQASIDLENGPLVKLALFKTDEGEHLLITIHHLVVDGVSWRIILEDFESSYKMIQNNEEIKLPLKTDSFKRWSKNLQDFAQSNELKKQVDYWVKIESSNIKSLPRDNRVLKRKERDCSIASMTLDTQYTEMLLKDVNKAYNTEINDILLTALGQAFKKWTGEHLVLINLEAHGREEIIKEIDITRTVGWFTSQYPVILDMCEDNDLSKLVKNIKEDLRHIPDKGIGYGVLKYLSPEEIISKDKFNLQPEISFNYLGQFDEDLKTEMFEISKMPTGMSASQEIERKYAFDINGMVIDNKLVLNFSYDEHEYNKSTVQKLVDYYYDSLTSIIDHCVKKTDSDITPSDLGDNTLSIEDLDYITDLFEN
ncbi:non-ribosomal peptide synthetase [Oceanirhabdus sp. W0125-5]|uniref:non-ribosomal peptide synthetase n=1 Tax=Oceanirhabdus sp. W0125-5 TaxID=2999116 RepID=UPI0022F32BDE|nr:non-ribosomal peptide synthetase [Oceanirhabdus sp. W0125-5]WBW96387.1 amino acid adenylation domain-containing protein [Oceanirhabdus sp. W0125-5]